MRIGTKLTRRGIDVERDVVNIAWEIDLKTGKFMVDFEKIEEQQNKIKQR